jgi:hypothetical protein
MDRGEQIVTRKFRSTTSECLYKIAYEFHPQIAEGRWMTWLESSAFFFVCYEGAKLLVRVNS